MQDTFRAGLALVSAASCRCRSAKHARGVALPLEHAGRGRGAVPSPARRRRAGVPAEQTTGRGSGVDDAGLQEKARIVQAAVDRARQAHPPPPDLQERALPSSDGAAATVDGGRAARVPREFAEAMLEEVGGLELAAIAGAIIAARDVRTARRPSANSSTSCCEPL